MDKIIKEALRKHNSSLFIIQTWWHLSKFMLFAILQYLIKLRSIVRNLIKLQFLNSNWRQNYLNATSERFQPPLGNIKWICGVIYLNLDYVNHFFYARNTVWTGYYLVKKSSSGEWPMQESKDRIRSRKIDF